MNNLGKSIYRESHRVDNHYCRAAGMRVAMNGYLLAGLICGLLFAKHITYSSAVCYNKSTAVLIVKPKKNI
jgi:hypothetical protein